MSPVPLPDDKQLERFVLGNGTECEEQQVLAYLENDPQGPERLKRIDQRLGTLVTGLRSSGYGSEAAFWRGLHAARHIFGDKSQQDLLGNSRFGFFELGKRLDHGGMGRVYVALDTRNNRNVAMKFIAPGRQQDEQAVKRFRRETALITGLNHPNIVKCLEAGELQGSLYIAMELLEGMDLGELVRQKGPLPENAVVQIALQTARSLIALECQGLVHRDLKPSNLFLTVDGTIKLLDLGLARNLAEGDSSLTGDDWVLGTFDYMAPEQAMDVKVADHRSDLYSLGCSLFMLLTGRPPYPKPEFATPMKKALAHSNIPLSVPCLEKPGVSSKLSQLLAFMCEKSPAKRPQSAKEIENILAQNQSSGNLAALLALDGKIGWIDTETASVKEGAKPAARFLALVSMLSVLLMLVPFTAWLVQPFHSNGQEDAVKLPSMMGENPNLVSNPSFTKGFHFYRYQLANTGYYGEFIPDNSRGMDDHHSIRFEANGSHAEGAIALISDNIPLEVGKKYTFSVWFDASQMTSGNLSADLADTHDIRLNAVNGKPGWQKMEAEFKALRPVIRVRLIRDGEIKLNEKGWIDFLQIKTINNN